MGDQRYEQIAQAMQRMLKKNKKQKTLGHLSKTSYREKSHELNRRGGI